MGRNEFKKKYKIEINNIGLFQAGETTPLCLSYLSLIVVFDRSNSFCDHYIIIIIIIAMVMHATPPLLLLCYLEAALLDDLNK